MDIGIAALSELQTPDCGEIMVGGYTCYWSGRTNGDHAQGVAVAVSNKLTPMIIEVTPVNERIMRRRIRHSLGVISLVSVYAQTEASDLTVKDAFYDRSLWLIGAPGEILFSSWEISMHQLELMGMLMRCVLVPMGLEL